MLVFNGDSGSRLSADRFYKLQADKLQRLQQSITVAIDASQAQVGGSNAGTWSFDAALLWEILVYENDGSCGSSENLSSVLGGHLLPRSSATEPSVQGAETEFDLIRSEGIASHKTAHTQPLLHAPGQAAWTLESAPNFQAEKSVPAVAPEGASPAFLEAMVGVQGQESFFLGADDYGRTIDAWLDLDVVP